MSKDDINEDKFQAVLKSFEKDYYSKRKNRLLWVTTIIGLLLTSFTMVVSIYSIGSNKEYVEKAALKVTLCEVIDEGGNLEIVKHAFNSREVIVKRIYLGKEDQSSIIQEFYDNEKLTLADVVQDLIVDYYLNEDSILTISGQIYHPKDKDSTYLKRLESTLKELQLKNPFDELEIEQRTLFQNVQAKLSDTNYNLIKEDISLISKTLSDKNALTKQYLQKSNTSFWISIIAVLITIIFGIIQLYQSITKKRKDESVYKRLFEKFDQTK